ncbi:MAG: hypothetical protein AAF725_18440 [Acidobacteriota bacterium]
MRKVHLTNAAGRDATVDFTGLKPERGYRLGLPEREAHFRRYLAAADGGLHEDLARAHGEDYGEALIEGDPEIDLEWVGREIGETTQVYLSSEGEVLHAPPEEIDVIYGPDGEERERREKADVLANVNEEMLPVRWSSRRYPRAELPRRFVVSRTIQVRHYDGLTYDYLHQMARELDEADEVALVGSGAKGSKPLIFQTNGTPFRAFLEGRVDGERYMLLMHLSNMELRRPVEDPKP